jgi:dTDP-4-dehydrorhamnose 3,5-epimerase
MEFKEHFLEGVIEFFPRQFHDTRGWFMESFNEKAMQAAGIPTNFVQDNQSVSYKNVLRGLHFQKPPHAQAKLVRAVAGRVLDVIVDIRKSSATYGKHLARELSAEQNNLLYVPEGFAHGFLALEENSVFLYKCSDYYHHASESGLLWNDPDLNINWNVAEPIVSDKDQVLPLFKDFVSPF